MAKEPWKNRIVGYEEVSAEKLLANPLNWRLHPATQRKALKGVLDSVGFVQSVVVNKNTGHLIDGHLRVDLAKQRGETVPVVWVDLTPAEERAMLAALDPLAAMAEKDAATLKELLMQTDAEADLQSLIEDIHGGVIAFEPEMELERRDLSELVADENTVEFTSAPRFGSSNRWGMPDWDAEDLAQHCPDGLWPDSRYGDDEKEWLVIYKSVSMSQIEGKTVAFWRHDDVFETLFTEAAASTERLLAHGVKACVAPDFSTYAADPAVVQLWAIYKRQWVGRYWQKSGIPVIWTSHPPSWESEFDLEWMTAGVPESVPVFAISTQGVNHVDRDQRKVWLKGLHMLYERVKWEKCMVYGYLEHWEWLANNLPQQPEYVLVPTFRWLRTNKLLTRGGAQRAPVEE
jgi:hypothetical protein